MTSGTSSKTPQGDWLLGGAKDPTPLSDEEVMQIQKHMRGEAAEPRPKVLFELGENVRVD